MKKQSLLLLLLTVSFALASLSGCGKQDKSKQNAATDSARLIDTMIATMGSFVERETFTATVEASVRNNISPQMPMRINKLLVEVGDRVQRGQILARMDNTSFNQQKVQLDNRKADLDRAQELYQIGGISKAQWEQAKMAHDMAQNQYTNISDNTLLRSPVSGLITARNYDNGDMYNGQIPIYVVEEISPVKLRINVSEQYFGRIKPKMPVSIIIEALGDQAYTGYVSLIYPTVDARTHTFGVEIEIPNKDKDVRPGMYARAHISFGTKAAIMVSDRAVIKQMGSDERYVFVLNRGKAEQRSVSVGRQDSTRYEIKTGLKVGEAVITAGAANLADGDSVKLNTKQATR